jgi:hypothetical protein
VPKSLVASPLVIFGHHSCVISMVPSPGRQYYHNAVEPRIAKIFTDFSFLPWACLFTDV